MGEEVGGVPEAAPVGAAEGADEAAGGGSIGRYLARQRQLREITLEQLASLTKIPVRSLERLEAGAFDQQLDGFARGFVRTVAEALGLDPDEAVMRLMREPPEEAPGRRRAAPARGVLLGAGLLLGALLLGTVVWRLLAAPRGPAPEVRTPEVVLRQDPVRSLAREQAELESPAPAAPPAEP